MRKFVVKTFLSVIELLLSGFQLSAQTFHFTLTTQSKVPQEIHEIEITRDGGESRRNGIKSKALHCLKTAAYIEWMSARFSIVSFITVHQS